MSRERFIGPLGWPRPAAGDALAPYRLPGRTLVPTYSGRTATDLAVRALGLKPGDAVLAPAYSVHCELEVFRRHGVSWILYPVDGRCGIDPDALARLAGPAVRALYVIHYFGLPQPAARWLPLARARGWAVIEDCAHSIFAAEDGQLTGTRGDVALFSFQKTLGLPDGGLLLGNRPLPGLPERLPPPPLRQVAGAVARQWLLSHAPDWVLRAGHARALRSPRRSVLTFNPNVVDRGPSVWTARGLAAFDPAAAVAGRRRVFAQLLDGCPRGPRLRPLFDVLPAGASPMLFPVWCADRRAAQLALARRGIVAYRWWTGPHPLADVSAFPAVRDLRDRVLALPCHWQLADPDAAAIVRALQDAATGGTP